MHGQEKESKSPVEIDTLFVQELIDSIKFSNSNNTETFKKAFLNIQIEDNVKAKQLRLLVYFFYNKKLYDRCIEFIDEAIKYLETPKDSKHLYNLNIIKGNAYLYSWRYTKALDAYYIALETNRKILKDDIKETRANLNIAIVYRKMGRYSQAKKEYKNILKFIEKNNGKNDKTYVKVLSEISFLFIDIEEYDSVLPYSNVGIQISEQQQYKDEIGNFYTAKGIVFYHKENYNISLQYLFEAEKYLYEAEVPEKRYIINNTYYIGNCLYEQEKYKQSIEKIHEVVNLINENEFNTEATDLYSLLAKANKAIGNESEAIHWYEKSIELDNRSEKEKDSTVNRIFDKEKEELNETIDVLIRNKSKVMIVLLLLLIVVIIISTIYIRKQQTNKLTFSKLIDKIDSLEKTNKERNLSQLDVKEITIDNQKINSVLRGLERLEDQEYFLNIDCNLRSIAKKVRTNTTYLSKIINNHKKKNFNDYINDLRINYVLKRLKNDKKFRLFSIKSIASEIGYKSDYSFAKHFKAKTGLNPSYYIREINSLEE